MRLTLNSWPPLASHSACILVGMSLAQLSTGSSTFMPPANAVVLSVPSSQFKLGVAAVKPGSRVHLLRAPAGLPPCRLSVEPVLLLATAPAMLLSVKLSEVAIMPLVAREAKAANLVLRPYESGMAVPACARRQRVSYGGA